MHSVLFIKGPDLRYLVKTPALNEQNNAKTEKKTFFFIISGRSGGKEIEHRARAPLENYHAEVDEHVYHSDDPSVFIKRREGAHRVSRKDVAGAVEKTYREARRSENGGGASETPPFSERRASR